MDREPLGLLRAHRDQKNKGGFRFSGSKQQKTSSLQSLIGSRARDLGRFNKAGTALT
jgi:hypothetical protein